VHAGRSSERQRRRLSRLGSGSLLRRCGRLSCFRGNSSPPSPVAELSVAVEPWGGHTSTHDPQKCCAAGTGWNDIDDGSPGVEFRPDLPQRPAGLGSSGEAVLIIYICVWLLQCDGVFLRFPTGAAVMVIAHAVRVFQQPVGFRTSSARGRPKAHHLKISAERRCCNSPYRCS
jgi:hypothetical protein